MAIVIDACVAQHQGDRAEQQDRVALLPHPKGGGVEHGPRIFAQPTCHHAPELYGGVGEAASAALLRGFFAERR